MPLAHSYYVYLMTNKYNNVMCVGVTKNLARRVHEHKNRIFPDFTKKYYVNKLVYLEETQDIVTTIAREKEIKKWRREKKNSLFATCNPEWKDLSEEWQEISPRGHLDCQGILYPDRPPSCHLDRRERSQSTSEIFTCWGLRFLRSK